MAKCYICQIEITPDNESEEHIIPNACGGRLKSKKLLCKTHNSEFGNSFDNQLAKQTNLLTNLLLIKRDRGKPQPIKGKIQSTGEEYYLEPGGKPVMAKPKIEIDDGQLSIAAKNEKEMKRILDGMKRNNPELDVEQALNEAKYQRKYFNEPVEF